MIGRRLGIADPVEQARAQDARSQPALAGDDQHAARPQRRLAKQKIDQLAVSGVLRVAVQVEAGVDLVLAAADAALAGQIFGRTGTLRRGQASAAGRLNRERGASGGGLVARVLRARPARERGPA